MQSGAVAPQLTDAQRQRATESKEAARQRLARKRKRQEFDYCCRCNASTQAELPCMEDCGCITCTGCHVKYTPCPIHSNLTATENTRLTSVCLRYLFSETELSREQLLDNILSVKGTGGALLNVYLTFTKMCENADYRTFAFKWKRFEFIVALFLRFNPKEDHTPQILRVDQLLQNPYAQEGHKERLALIIKQRFPVRWRNTRYVRFLTPPNPWLGTNTENWCVFNGLISSHVCRDTDRTRVVPFLTDDSRLWLINNANTLEPNMGRLAHWTERREMSRIFVVLFLAMQKSSLVAIFERNILRIIKSFACSRTPKCPLPNDNTACGDLLKKKCRMSRKYEHLTLGKVYKDHPQYFRWYVQKILFPEIPNTAMLLDRCLALDLHL